MKTKNTISVCFYLVLRIRRRKKLYFSIDKCQNKIDVGEKKANVIDKLMSISSGIKSGIHVMKTSVRAHTLYKEIYKNDNSNT